MEERESEALLASGAFTQGHPTAEHPRTHHLICSDTPKRVGETLGLCVLMGRTQDKVDQCQVHLAGPD